MSPTSFLSLPVPERARFRKVKSHPLRRSVDTLTSILLGCRLRRVELRDSQSEADGDVALFYVRHQRRFSVSFRENGSDSARGDANAFPSLHRFNFRFSSFRKAITCHFPPLAILSLPEWREGGTRSLHRPDRSGS